MGGRVPVWRRRLISELTGEDDRSQRLLRAAKVIQDALAAAGLSMVVVGGSAVTAYDPDAYTSLDIDLVGAGLTARLDEVLRDELGLSHEGRHWFDEELGVAVERPGSSLEPPGARAVMLEVPGIGDIIVISVEDLICDRLNSWAASGHYDSWAQAARLALNETTDQDRLRRRATDLALDQHLIFALWLQEEHAAGRGDRAEVAPYVHELNTRTAADVIQRVVHDRAKPLADAAD
jgi:hypothetical protein